MTKKNTPSDRKYFRLTKAERKSIEQALSSKKSARQVARELGRSPSTIINEVKRHRFISCGKNKGELVQEMPEEAKICGHLSAWPWCCNRCPYGGRYCNRRWKCRYDASLAQHLADQTLVDARRGVNMSPEEYEALMSAIRHDVSRGLSPAQIVEGRKEEFNTSTSSIYRWIEKGYYGMTNLELRRKVGYKKRIKHTTKPTAHGKNRSYKAFLALGEETCESACEMDTVIGKSHDSQCILTLYLRPYHFQFALLLPEKTSSAVTAALDGLEEILGLKLFKQLFGLILTDNGVEFSDFKTIERSAVSKRSRTKVYYCDVRQSQQKAGCERNHVELRKLLPKGRNISFDDLDSWDMSVVMSEMNSEPRPSLLGASPISLFLACQKQAAAILFPSLGIEEIAYKDLLLNIKAINKARKERCLPPLI
jgi:IS30 family transposase